MLRISIFDEPFSITLKLEGRLVCDWIPEAQRSWSQARQNANGRKVMVDMFGLTFVDDRGRELLALMHLSGARLVGSGPMISGLIEEIQSERPAKGPVNYSTIVSIFIGLLLFIAAFALSVQAQETMPIQPISAPGEAVMARLADLPSLSMSRPGLQSAAAMNASSAPNLMEVYRTLSAQWAERDLGYQYVMKITVTASYLEPDERESSQGSENGAISAIRRLFKSVPSASHPTGQYLCQDGYGRMSLQYRNVCPL